MSEVNQTGLLLSLLDDPSHENLDTTFSLFLPFSLAIVIFVGMKMDEWGGEDGESYEERGGRREKNNGRERIERKRERERKWWRGGDGTFFLLPRLIFWFNKITHHLTLLKKNSNPTDGWERREREEREKEKEGWGEDSQLTQRLAVLVEWNNSFRRIPIHIILISCFRTTILANYLFLFLSQSFHKNGISQAKRDEKNVKMMRIPFTFTFFSSSSNSSLSSSFSLSSLLPHFLPLSLTFSLSLIHFLPNFRFYLGIVIGGK